MKKTKGQFRQEYTLFYYDVAKPIIENFNEKNGYDVNGNLNEIGLLNKRYNRYIAKCIGLVIIGMLFLLSPVLLPLIITAIPILGIFGILMLFLGTGLFIPIGIGFIIAASIMFALMPKDLKKMSKERANLTDKFANKIFDNSGKAKFYTEYKDEMLFLKNTYDYEYELKEKLMNKFLSIFGDFTWQKNKSFFEIDNLIILPDKLTLDTDDSISGKFRGINIKISEVIFGLNAIYKSAVNHAKIVANIAKIIPIAFFICFFSFFINYNISYKLFSIYGILFMITWFLGFFSIPILAGIFLINKNSRGLVIEIDMPKNFTGDTVIFERAFSNIFVEKNKLKVFTKTELEDIEFNKKYSLYTTDQIEARYVLTTGFMEALKNIRFKFNSDYMRLRFKDNRITIFTSVRKDLFVMGKREKFTDLNVFNELFEELYSVLSLVEELKLDIKTGL